MDPALARSPGTPRGFRGLKCGHERSVPSGCGSAGAREPRRAGESWGAALSQVVEFPISRWPEVREATLAPAVARRGTRDLLDGDSAQVRESEGAWREGCEG